MRALDGILALTRPGRPSPVAKVISLYLDNWPSQMVTLRGAVEAGDVDAMWKTAHALKSSSATVGALGLSALFKQIESTGRAGTMTGVDTALSEIDSQFPAVQAALASIREEHAA